MIPDMPSQGFWHTFNHCSVVGGVREFSPRQWQNFEIREERKDHFEHFGGCAKRVTRCINLLIL